MTNKKIEIPKLSDDPGYASAAAKMAELQAEKNRLEALQNEILGDLNDDSQRRTPKNPIVAAAERLLSGEAEPKPTRLQESLGEAQRKLTIVDEAIRMQRRTVEAELSRASLAVCDSLQPQHKENVRRIVDALKQLDAALAAEHDLRDGLRLEGYHVSTIRPMPWAHIGLLRDQYSRISRYLIECHEHKFLDRDELLAYVLHVHAADLDTGAVDEDKIAGAAVLELCFDAPRPDLVLAARVQQNAAVGRLLGPSPFEMKSIILVRPLGAHVAVGLAFTAHHTFTH